MSRGVRMLIVLVVAVAMAAMASYAVYQQIQRIPVREVEVASQSVLVAAKEPDSSAGITTPAILSTRYSPDRKTAAVPLVT